MLNLNWKEAIDRLADNFYSHVEMKLTLDEMFRGLTREYRNEASSDEMAAYFKQSLARAKAFYADTKTVDALMAYSH